MDDERERLRHPGRTGPTAHDGGTEFGGGRVGADADFDPDTSGFVGQAGAGTDDVGSERRAPLDAGARGAAGGAVGAVGGIIVGGVVAGPPGALIGGVVGAVGGAVVGGATADELEGGASDDDAGRTIDRGPGASE